MSESFELIRHYRQSLNEIAKASRSSSTELRAMALLALRGDGKPHHVWCASTDLYISEECPQCKDLWKEFPEAPRMVTRPSLGTIYRHQREARKIAKLSSGAQ